MNGATVRVYSKAKDGSTYAYKSDGKRCKNFKVKEFACHDGSDPIFISPELVDVLQQIRDYFGKAVHLEEHSGYRTASHNKSVGGTTNSQHLYGTAADIHVSGVAHKTVAEYAEKLLLGKGGIGIYPWGVHIDVRKTKSRWNG